MEPWHFCYFDSVTLTRNLFSTLNSKMMGLQMIKSGQLVTGCFFLFYLKLMSPTYACEEGRDFLEPRCTF